MDGYAASFFDGKRDWSEINDTVLSNYISAYLKKVQRLGKPILLIDAFAGPGSFGDGKLGSPLLMCQKAEEYAAENYFAIFVNKEKEHHLQLDKAIAPYKKKNRAIALHTDARKLLDYIQEMIANHTLFLYLDPFGLKGCEFEILKPLLSRVKQGHSTELLINVSMPTLHRQGSRRVVLEQGLDNIPSQTKAKIINVDKSLGGEYWRGIEWDPCLPKDVREERIMREYHEQLGKYTNYVMSCPVRESEGTHTKCYIIFCSRHVDALVLMNDTMGNAYNNYMHNKSKEELPLFATDSDEFYEWERGREKAIKWLYELIPIYVRKNKPRLTRKHVWEQIVSEHFMQFIEKEYRQMVKKLSNEGKIVPIKSDGQIGLNDNCILYLPDDPR